MKIIDQIQAARRVGVPIVALSTADAVATGDTIAQNLGTGVVGWDLIRGAYPLNEAGQAASEAAVGGDAASITGPADILERAVRLPNDAVILVFQGDRCLSGPSSEAVIQGVVNLRDRFKQDGRMLVLLGASFSLPPELAHDVLTIEEPLPEGEALGEIVQAQVHAGKLPDLDAETLGRAVAAVRGLSQFAAEQAVALSLRKSGLDLGRLWARKTSFIRQTAGLAIDESVDDYDSIGGLAAVKEFGRRLLAGRDRPAAVIWVDEIEKQLAGASGDLSGVAQDQLGVLLQHMQAGGSTGMICVGPPGSAKSMFARATARTGGIPCVQLDLGAAKGSLVSESETKIRSALRVVTAIAGGHELWIATANGLDRIPPELRRRFCYGIWTFDLPSEDERAAIWRIYETKYGLDGQDHPNDSSWTGAEIRTCCTIAWRLDCSLKDASRFIVPVAVSSAEQVAALRRLAHHRFLDASRGGVYVNPTASPAPASELGRAINPEGN